MDARDALKLPINMGKFIATTYLQDLTDEEMMHRPAEGCNHIKWQLGHLIASEHGLMSAALPGAMPDLPAGFAEKYSKETATSDDPAAFDSKEELLRVFEEQRAGTLKALENASDADLEKDAPEMVRSFCPTVA